MDDRLISEDELDALLAQRDPIDTTRVSSLPLTVTLVALREEVMRDDAAGHRSERLARTRTSRRGRRFWVGDSTRIAPRRTRLVLGFTASAAAVAAASLIGVNVFGSGASRVTWLPAVAVAPAQADELNKIAVAAAQHAGPGKGQWLFQRYEVSEGSGTAVDKTEVNFRDTHTVQEWTNANDIQRTRSVFTSFRFDTPQDRANFYGRDHAQFARSLPAAPGTSSRVTDEADPSLSGSPLAAQNMPETELGILHRFEVLFDKDPTGYAKEPLPERNAQFANNLFGELAVIVANSTSERQRAGALKAFAYVKGVQMIGAHKDAYGRTGIEIRYVWDGGTGQINTLIIDPKTGDLLQQTNAEIRASAPAANNPQAPVFPVADGQQRTTYLQRAIVNSMSDLPDGGSQLYHGAPPRIAKAPK
jgi:hypothetical protein